MIEVSAWARIVNENVNAARISANIRTEVDLELVMLRALLPSCRRTARQSPLDDSTDPAWCSERPCRQPQFARRRGHRRAGQRLPGGSTGQRPDRAAPEQAE